MIKIEVASICESLERRIHWLSLYNDAAKEAQENEQKIQQKYEKNLSLLRNEIGDGVKCIELYLSYLEQNINKESDE